MIAPSGEIPCTSVPHHLNNKATKKDEADCCTKLYVGAGSILSNKCAQEAAADAALDGLSDLLALVQEESEDEDDRDDDEAEDGEDGEDDEERNGAGDFMSYFDEFEDQATEAYHSMNDSLRGVVDGVGDGLGGLSEGLSVESFQAMAEAATITSAASLKASNVVNECLDEKVLKKVTTAALCKGGSSDIFGKVIQVCRSSFADSTIRVENVTRRAIANEMLDDALKKSFPNLRRLTAPLVYRSRALTFYSVVFLIFTFIRTVVAWAAAPESVDDDHLYDDENAPNTKSRVAMVSVPTFIMGFVLMILSCLFHRTTFVPGSAITAVLLMAQDDSSEVRHNLNLWYGKFTAKGDIQRRMQAKLDEAREKANKVMIKAKQRVRGDLIDTMDGVRAGQDVIDAADDSDLVGGSLLLGTAEESKVNNKKQLPVERRLKRSGEGNMQDWGYEVPPGLGSIQKAYIKGEAIKMTLTGAIEAIAVMLTVAYIVWIVASLIYTVTLEDPCYPAPRECDASTEAIITICNVIIYIPGIPLMLNFIFAPFTLYLIMYGYLPVVIQRLGADLEAYMCFLDEHPCKNVNKNLLRNAEQPHLQTAEEAAKNARHLKNNRMDMQATFRKIRTITRSVNSEGAKILGLVLPLVALFQVVCLVIVVVIEPEHPGAWLYSVVAPIVVTFFLLTIASNNVIVDSIFENLDRRRMKDLNTHRAHGILTFPIPSTYVQGEEPPPPLPALTLLEASKVHWADQVLDLIKNTSVGVKVIGLGKVSPRYVVAQAYALGAVVSTAAVYVISTTEGR